MQQDKNILIREIVAVFQPHTFSRTQTFLDDFAESLKLADKVYLCEIFGSARENHGKLSIKIYKREYLDHKS